MPLQSFLIKYSHFFLSFFMDIFLRKRSNGLLFLSIIEIRRIFYSQNKIYFLMTFFYKKIRMLRTTSFSKNFVFFHYWFDFFLFDDQRWAAPAPDRSGVERLTKISGAGAESEREKNDRSDNSSDLSLQFSENKRKYKGVREEIKSKWKISSLRNNYTAKYIRYWT